MKRNDPITCVTGAINTCPVSRGKRVCLHYFAYKGIILALSCPVINFMSNMATQYVNHTEFIGLCFCFVLGPAFQTRSEHNAKILKVQPQIRTVFK